MKQYVNPADARVIFVSSRMEKWRGEFNLANIQGQLSYDRTKFYSMSKLYMVRSILFLKSSHTLYTVLCFKKPANTPSQDITRCCNVFFTVPSTFCLWVQLTNHKLCRWAARRFENFLSKLINAGPGFCLVLPQPLLTILPFCIHIFFCQTFREKSNYLPALYCDWGRKPSRTSSQTIIIQLLASVYLVQLWSSLY